MSIMDKKQFKELIELSKETQEDIVNVMSQKVYDMVLQTVSEKVWNVVDEMLFDTVRGVTIVKLTKETEEVVEEMKSQILLKVKDNIQHKPEWRVKK